MSTLSILKKISILPFMRTATTEKYGSSDSWCLLKDSLNKNSTILSAGVGKNITFEEDIICKHNAKIILFDPSDTGVNTMKDRGWQLLSIEFHQMGLAGSSGNQCFARPDRAEEGSFRKGTSSEGLSFRCVTVDEVMRERKISSLDLLKIDIEGFEYEVINLLINQKIRINQICVEIHTNRQIKIDKTIWDAYKLILRMYQFGYRIIYNHAMDFTFVRSELLR